MPCRFNSGKTDMAGKKQAWTATQLKGLLKTRRINQIENSTLATRLKVLDLKKNQTYTQIDMERDSLREDMQKIQHIKKEVPISAERRKLFRNGSRNNIQVDTERGDSKLGLEGADGAFPINGHSRKSSGKAESPVMKSNKAELFSRRDSTKSLGADSGDVRARRRFRVIAPPNRPGSRRNFLPVPDKVLQKEQQKLENGFARKEGRVFDKHQTIRRSLSDTSIGSSSKHEVPSPTSANGSVVFRIANDLPNKEVDDRGIQHSVSRYETQCGLATTSRDVTGRYPGSCSNEKNVDSDAGVFGSATGASLAENPALFQDSSNASLAERPTRKSRSHGPIILKLRPQTQHSHRKFSRDRLLSQKRGPGSSGTEQQMLTGKTGLLYSMRCRSCFKSCPNLNVADVNDVTRHSTKKNMPCRPGSTKLCGGRRHSFTSTRDRSRPTSKREKDEGVHVYDARPNKSLSKGYQKMQVKIGKKQLSINMPRFSTNTNEPAVARMRAQFISEQFQPRLLAKSTTSKRETSYKVL